jgi:hypothetical protein
MIDKIVGTKILSIQGRSREKCLHELSTEFVWHFKRLHIEVGTICAHFFMKSTFFWSVIIIVTAGK